MMREARFFVGMSVNAAAAGGERSSVLVWNRLRGWNGAADDLRRSFAQQASDAQRAKRSRSSHAAGKQFQIPNIAPRRPSPRPQATIFACEFRGVSA
jgi:hypothetical protein